MGWLTSFHAVGREGRLNTQVTLFLVTLAGWMNRKQQSVIEYLLEENRVMKQQLNASGKKLRLSNVQRRSLAKKAKVTPSLIRSVLC
jgi:hypothetical protein